MTANDPALGRATEIVRRALADPARRPVVKSWFDEDTFTVTHVAYDPKTKAAAVIDSVLDFDPASGRTSGRSAEAVAAYVRGEGLETVWHLETHAHADHLSAAPRLQAELGGRIAVGREITAVQAVFTKVFNTEPDFVPDGRQFDRLFEDGDGFGIGELEAAVLHVPGHTPACVAYVIGDAAFVGDTLFMPDYGTARCDFPGGSATTLFRSIRRLLRLPDETRMFLCHDYKAPPARDHFAWETTVGDQRRGNIHVRDGVAEADFVAMREARDAGLAMPRLILPSIQVNIRGGRLPPPEDNGVAYLKLPIDAL